MVEVSNLSKKFGDVWALKNTSWKVKENRALGLLGPNGAGKSTTMKIMTGLLCATEGQIKIAGLDSFKEPQQTKAMIGYLPETPPLYDEMRVGSYLEFAAGLRGISGSERRKAKNRVIDKLNLGEVELKYIGALSKGFRQRVGIAQALVANPPIVVLDEPSVGLDPQQVFELRSLIQSLKGEHTVILSTHVLSEVQQICDDVVIVDKGEVIANGPIEDILSRIQHRHGLKLLLKTSTPQFLEDLEKLPLVEEVNNLNSGSVIEVLSDVPIECIDDFVQLALKHECGIMGVEKYKAALEDAYIQLTREGGAQ